jgi:hypothetical protein
MAFKGTYSAGAGYDTTVEMRESLLDIMRDISPNEDNYFMSNLAKGSAATQTLHEWNIYHEVRKTSMSAKAEGADTIFPDLQAETRSSNYTAILESPIKLSRTKASIAEVTGEDAFGKEKERALRRLKNEMEYAIINGTSAAGASGTARGLTGLAGCITTNVTNYSGAQCFTELVVNNMVQESYDSVGGSYVADLLSVPVVLKRRAATFGTNLTRNVNAEDKKLTHEVRVYDTEVGKTIMILANPDINKGAGNCTALLVREDLFELSFLVKSGEPHWEERSKSGDYVSGTYVTEFTLVSFNEKASAKHIGFLNTL